MKSATIAATLLLSLLAPPGNATAPNFTHQRLIGDLYAVSYPLSGKMPDLMLFIVGNTGELCLEEGYRWATLDFTGNSGDGEEVVAIVEFFAEQAEGREGCEDMAARPTRPKELDAWELLDRRKRLARAKARRDAAASEQSEIP